jgi:hypothetical protein
MLLTLKHIGTPYNTRNKSTDFGVAPRYKYVLGGVT